MTMESGDTASAGVREGTPPAPAGGEESKAPTENVTQPTNGETQSADRTDAVKYSPKEKCSKGRLAVKSKHKKSKTTASPVQSSSDPENNDSEDTTSSTSDSGENNDSETETVKSKRVAKKRDDSGKSKRANAKKQKKIDKTRGSVGSDSDSESSSSENDDQSSEDEKDQRTQEIIIKQLQQLKALIQQQQQQFQLQYQQHQQGNSYQYSAGGQHYGATLANITQQPVYESGLRSNPSRSRRSGQSSSGPLNPALNAVDSLLMEATQQLKEQKKQQKATKLDYKRVDQVWDNSIHNYKLQDTAERTVDTHYDEFIFHVRRTFDWEGKYKATYVDIKSKFLRECLQAVMGNIKGVSLVEETPKLDPNMLFL